MAVPLESVVKQLADSGIIAPGKLENFVPPRAHPKSVDELIAELVKQNQLTRFQGQQIKAGRVRALILGSYTILDRIGAGGMGRVFKAEHRRMHRIVAIKMLPAATMKDAAAIARFEREVTAAAKLRHPHIVAADDAAEANGTHFLVMEYVEGKDLSALVKQSGPFPVAKALNYILQAARGLEFAHAEGVVHRDIKPANLLLDAKGTVKILDMGLARIDSGSNAASESELTGTGAVMGTVDYMAPEQALNTKHADARADIYSLGITLYYLLAGKSPYGGDTIMEKLLAHRELPIPSLKAVQANVPDRVQAIFSKMVAKKVADRYQTMSEVVAALGSLQSGESGITVGHDGANTFSGTPLPPSEADSDVIPAILDVELSGPRPRSKDSRRQRGRRKLQPWQLLAIGAVGVAGCFLVAVLLLSTGSQPTKSLPAQPEQLPVGASLPKETSSSDRGLILAAPLEETPEKRRGSGATAGEPNEMDPPLEVASKPAAKSDSRATNEKPPESESVSPTPLAKMAPDSSASTPGKTVLPATPSEPASATPGSSDPPQASAESTRLPLPDEAATKKARELVKEVFGSDYAAAKGSPEDLEALAKTMLKQAADSKDVANRYVLLDVARTVSIDAGNAMLAFQALDEMREVFQTEGIDDKKLGIVEDVAKKARSPAENTALLTQIQPVLNEFLADDNFEAAKSLSKIAISVARKARDAGPLKAAAARNKEIEETAKVYAAEIKPARDALQQTPTDPAANLVVGKWLCFSKQAWDQGIPLLALCQDAALKQLAELEIAGDNKSKAADGWWNYAKKEVKAKQPIQAHAAGLYQEALPGLSGLEKAKAEQRLAEIESVAVAVESKAAKSANTGRAANPPSKVVKRSRGIERQVKIIAAGCDGHFICINDMPLMQEVKRETASGVVAPLRDGDIIAVKVRGRFDIMSLWMVFLTEDNQYLFETSTDWIAYLPPDQERWWDVQNQKIVREQAVLAPDSREYVDLVKNSISKVVSNYRVGQPIYSPLQNTQPHGKDVNLGYLPTYVYYVVTKGDLVPKKDPPPKK